jgi:hypothetical protein
MVDAPFGGAGVVFADHPVVPDTAKAIVTLVAWKRF